MKSTWDNILEMYIHNLISPDGRNTFESTPELVKVILQKAKITSNDTVIDIGCGWGNLTREIAIYSAHTIGIDPNVDNLNMAQSFKTVCPVKYLQGTFESLNCFQKIDVAVSSLVFHQVKYLHKTTALKNVNNLLNKKGRFVLCDTMIMFDAKHSLLTEIGIRLPNSSEIIYSPSLGFNAVIHQTSLAVMAQQFPAQICFELLIRFASSFAQDG